MDTSSTEVAHLDAAHVPCSEREVLHVGDDGLVVQREGVRIDPDEFERWMDIRLAELRLKRYQVADRAGWQPTKISMLSKQSWLTWETWSRLCAALERDPDEALEELVELTLKKEAAAKSE